MIGYIDTTAKCPECGGRFKYVKNRSGLFCLKHPHIRAHGPFRVVFGRHIGKRFGNDFKSAETFLLGLRHEMTTGKFDVRDYRSDAPLGFSNLAEKWLTLKEIELKKKSYNNLANYMAQASKVWGDTNVKAIKKGQIEDFLFSRKVSSKTRSNMKSCLHDFWQWISDREEIPMPKFPECSFKLGWRDIIDLETQQAIIDEVHRISYQVNPKIWLGIRMLSRYFHIRPGELLGVTEGQVNTKIPAIIIPDPKGPEPVLVFLHDDDVAEIEILPRGLPALPFFRHQPGRSGVAAGHKFGDRYLYKWWTKACENLGLMKSETRPIVDLYAGTRHSTMTALAEHLSPEEIQQASGQRTSKALMRYLQGKARYAQKAGAQVLEMQAKARGEIIPIISRKDQAND